MFANLKSATLGGIGALALACSSVFAATVPWVASGGTVGPNGSNSSMSWSNGLSDNGLFGSPMVSGSSFLFFPSNFKAQSSNGAAATTSDRLQVTITAPAGKEIKQVNISELGDFAITGGGSVKASGALYITKLNSPGFGTTYQDTLDTTYIDVAHGNFVYPPPAKHPNVPSNGTWSGDFLINLPAGVTSVQLVLNNILQTTSSPNGTAIIQKKVLGGPEFKIDVIIPEPTSLSFLGLGAVALLRRSRRKTVTN